jgi:hypothetical protein
MMEKVPVPVTGASYSPSFLVCFIDLFSVFWDLGFFIFQLFLQLLVLGIVQCVIDAEPISSSKAEGGFTLMPAAPRDLEQVNGQDSER